MVFSSYRFILVFFPIVLLGYHLLRLMKRETPVKLWLTAASLVFYGLGQPDFLLMFALSVVLNYLILRGLGRTARRGLRRGLMGAAVLWNLGLLGYYKYADFFLSNVNWLLHTRFPMVSAALPIGISFFTFQILACAVSRYAGDCETPDFLDYAAFVTFFPQLIVGPVVRQEELLPQLRDGRLLRFDPAMVCRGSLLFSVGCAKKILLADPMIDYAAAFYAGEPGSFSFAEAWAGVLCYVFAYYFDFSGYIDMARGLGCFFGVTLPENFDSPYKARNFADFWRRWNITISRFFNDAVFHRLFGFGDGVGKLILATLATFAVSGLWHGAGWHFIAWGLANGVFVCAANLRALYDRKPLPAWLGIALTFFFGTLIRVLFDSAGLAQAAAIYRKLLDLRPLLHVRTFFASLASFAAAKPLLAVLLLLSAALCFFAPNSNRIMQKERFSAGDAAFAAALLALSLFHMTRVSTFLYFNF